MGFFEAHEGGSDAQSKYNLVVRSPTLPLPFQKKKAPKFKGSPNVSPNQQALFHAITTLFQTFDCRDFFPISSPLHLILETFANLLKVSASFSLNSFIVFSRRIRELLTIPLHPRDRKRANKQSIKTITKSWNTPSKQL